jgi:hypothetical protein
MYGKLLSSIASTDALLRENLEIMHEITYNNNFTEYELFCEQKLGM